jgi:hypothetical protein
VYVDLYGRATNHPLDWHISEVRIHGTVKGGAQRQS